MGVVRLGKQACRCGKKKKKLPPFPAFSAARAALCPALWPALVDNVIDLLALGLDATVLIASVFSWFLQE